MVQNNRTGYVLPPCHFSCDTRDIDWITRGNDPAEGTWWVVADFWGDIGVWKMMCSLSDGEVIIEVISSSVRKARCPVRFGSPEDIPTSKYDWVGLVKDSVILWLSQTQSCCGQWTMITSDKLCVRRFTETFGIHGLQTLSKKRSTQYNCFPELS